MKRIIPSSREKIPAIGLGTWQSFDVGHRETQRINQKQVLKTLYDQGGRVVDSSPMYGRSEKVVGDLALDLGINQKLFMATKVWTSGREAGIAQMNQSMAYMQANPMDLIQVHNMLDCQTHLKTLRQWKEEGKVRYIGITHYTESAHPELIRWIKRESIDFVQFNYSLFDRNAEKELLPLCQEKGVATLINLPFGAGSFLNSVIHEPLPYLAGEIGCQTWAQFLLKYILGHPAVTCVIPGTSNPDHLLDNLRAGEGVLPSENQRRAMVNCVL